MAAIFVGDAIDAAVARLGDHPAMAPARPGRVGSTRELVVTGTPYVIDRVEAAAVVVLRVLGEDTPERDERRSRVSWPSAGSRRTACAITSLRGLPRWAVP